MIIKTCSYHLHQLLQKSSLHGEMFGQVFYSMPDRHCKYQNNTSHTFLFHFQQLASYTTLLTPHSACYVVNVALHAFGFISSQTKSFVLIANTCMWPTSCGLSQSIYNVSFVKVIS